MYMWRAFSSEFGDALVVTVTEQVWRYIWMPQSREIGGRNRNDLQIHLEVVIERLWRP